MKQAKRVWKWAIERGEGKAWLYYIFGICQWLPVNHRTHYNEKSGRGLEKCFLCLTNSVESQAHLYQCPALNQEQSDISHRYLKSGNFSNQNTRLSHRTKKYANSGKSGRETYLSLRLWILTDSRLSFKCTGVLTIRSLTSPSDASRRAFGRP